MLACPLTVVLSKTCCLLSKSDLTLSRLLSCHVTYGLHRGQRSVYNYNNVFERFAKKLGKTRHHGDRSNCTRFSLCWQPAGDTVYRVMSVELMAAGYQILDCKGAGWPLSLLVSCLLHLPPPPPPPQLLLPLPAT